MMWGVNGGASWLPLVIRSGVLLVGTEEVIICMMRTLVWELPISGLASSNVCLFSSNLWPKQHLGIGKLWSWHWLLGYFKVTSPPAGRGHLALVLDTSFTWIHNLCILMESFRGHPRPALWPRGGTRREESGGNGGQILLGLLRDCLLIWEDLKSTVNPIEKSTIERGLKQVCPSDMRKLRSLWKYIDEMGKHFCEWLYVHCHWGKHWT